MLRSTSLRQQRRITTSAAPVAAPHLDTNPRPEAECCGCCDPRDCPTPNRHDDGGCPLVGHEATAKGGMIGFRCNACSWSATSHDAARLHESRYSDHRVTAWDSPTSQLPRSIWTSRS